MAAAPPTLERVRDVVGLYLAPPDRALVPCVDESWAAERTNGMQAVERTQPVLPVRPGQPERRTSDYLRHGTSSLFAALDAAVGEVIGRRYRRHRAEEFRDFLAAVDAALPPEPEVRLVLDDASIHKAPPVKAWLLGRPRYHLHFTPTASSWLNQAERSFALLTARPPARARHAPLGRGAGGRGAGLPRAPRRRARALPLEQVGRPDPGQRRPRLRAHPRGPRPATKMSSEAGY